jgi:hypothetical protein
MQIDKTELEYKPEEEVKLNKFKLVNAVDFVQMASIPHCKKVDKFGARYLNLEFDITIYWCSIKKDGEEFDAYLADLGYGKNERTIQALLTFLS